MYSSWLCASSNRCAWSARRSADFIVVEKAVNTAGIAAPTRARAIITSSRDYAIEGFELKARHYIIKPISEEKIVEALNRCLAMLTEDCKAIKIPVGKLERAIRLKDIIYVEVFNKVSVIHTANEEIKTYLPLTQLESVLGGSPFLRCHRCSIVNMNCVEDFTTTDFIMKNGDRVGIPRSNSVAVRQQYLDFVFSKVRGDISAK